MTFYADEATLVIKPGRCVTGHTALRKAFIAIAEQFTHTLRVSQEEVLVLEGAGTALVLAKTRVRGTLKSSETYDVLRRATYVFRRAARGRGAAPSTTHTAQNCSRRAYRARVAAQEFGWATNIDARQ